jgi:hypothetical protein
MMRLMMNAADDDDDEEDETKVAKDLLTALHHQLPFRMSSEQRAARNEKRAASSEKREARMVMVMMIMRMKMRSDDVRPSGDWTGKRV